MKILASFLFIFVTSFSFSATVNSEIMSYSGDVKINGKPASKSLKINFNDTISCGKKSFCDIIIGKKNIVRIGQNAQLIFKISESSNELILKSGWLSGVTREKFTRQGSYKIITPTITASVRGTSYCVNIESPESSYFCVCNGKIEFTKKDSKNKEVIESSHHAAKRYIMNPNGKYKIETPGLLYHEDANVEALAGLINEKIDWTKADSK